MKKILVCEDESAIRDFVVINLQRSGYTTVAVSSGEEALRVFGSDGGDFDVALLDIMMPGIDGFTVCKELRQRSNCVGIVMLTAKSQEEDKVKGLTLGADDYVVKPFSPSELVARVEAIYRRVLLAKSLRRGASTPLVSGDFVLNPRSRTLMRGGKAVELTQVEYQLMELFIKNKGIALGRNRILDDIWGEDYYGDEKIVDVNVRRLRMKIEEEPSKPQHLLTVWGYGYKWQE